MSITWKQINWPKDVLEIYQNNQKIGVLDMRQAPESAEILNLQIIFKLDWPGVLQNIRGVEVLSKDTKKTLAIYENSSPGLGGFGGTNRLRSKNTYLWKEDGWYKNGEKYMILKRKKVFNLFWFSTYSLIFKGKVEYLNDPSKDEDFPILITLGLYLQVLWLRMSYFA